MLPEQIKNHREVVTLKDGTYVLLRALLPEDEERLLEMFSTVSEEDAFYFRHNVRDPEIVKSWCRDIDYNKVLPMIALVKDRAVGSATLHFYDGPRRHIGEIRIFLAKDYRKRGLGMKMSRSLMEMARKFGLSILVAEVVTDMTKVVKAFEQLGFKTQCVLEDHFMLPDGDTCDVAFMTMNLRPKVDEF